MDGVICDFAKRYVDLYGINPHDETNKNFNANFDKFIEDGNFASLELMPDAEELIFYLLGSKVPTQILSSTARKDRHDAISKQKIFWLQKYGIRFNPIFVPGKRLKKQYATPDSLIIDDSKVVIDDWVEAGGSAIWHKDVPSTIDILKRLYEI